MSIKPLKISLLIMGLSGMVGQIVLLRELLISFFGNELTIGVILANWLILEAIGSFFLGRSVERTGRRLEIYVLFQLIFSGAFPFAVYLSRIFKNLLWVTPGEGLGLLSVFYSSALILVPMALPHGALFTYGCKLHSEGLGEEAASVGKVYILETIGSMAGGLAMTFLLIQYLNSFQVALAISLTNTLISVFLLWPGETPSPGRLRPGLLALSILLTLFWATVLLSPVSKEIHLSSIRSQWRDLEVIHYENSIYGNIAVARRGEQFTFFTDGVPSITTPVPDIASVEDFVHFPMLFHPKPEFVLVLTGGAGGMIHELLKYPLKRVDYVELDPLLLRLVQRFPTPLTQSELSDTRVRIHYADGRFFIRRTPDRFDIIFIGLSAPQSLQTNRLFSAEFFSTAKAKMNPQGIIALTLPGSLTYISPELRNLNKCILETLKSVFRYGRVIPGDVNLYLASDSAELESVSSGELGRRLTERQIPTSLFTKGYIEERLQKRWDQWFLQALGGERIHINSDFRPLGVFFSLSYWNALFSPQLTGPFRWFEGINLSLLSLLVTLLTFLMTILFMMRPRLSRQSLPYAIFATGLAGMIFNLSIIFTFQTLYGYLYYQIGLLVSLFMAGVALGSLSVTRRLHQIRAGSRLFLEMEVGIILFSLLFPLVFSVLSAHLEITSIRLLLGGAFLMMSFLSGAIIGLQFPLATKIYLGARSDDGTLGHTAGLLYGADLLGGFLGGLLGGVVLVPVLGLKGSCFMVSVIKVSSCFLFFVFTQTRRRCS